jgi:LuxR family maltose regulon positive regulatory protein
MIRPQFLQIRLLIAQHRAGSGSGLAQVLAYLDEQFSYIQARGWTELMIDGSLVQAMALQAQGKLAQATTSLERALALAEPGRWVRIFVDEGRPMADLLRGIAAKGNAQAYANRLLAALKADEQVTTRARTQASSAGAAAGLVESLSERELDVLRLLPSDLSSAEIARALYVSVTTVRSHIGHIYSKVDVHSREEAEQRGQALGLL